jgi:hypothetical protein
VQATDQVGDLIQQGVELEYADPEGPSCNLGASAPALYYFTEVIHSNNATCYASTAAAYSAANLQTVDRGSSGLWTAYRNGQSTGITTSWTACGGNACLIAAYGEDHNLRTGKWSAKFAGSGNTEWQWWNGTSWGALTSGYHDYVDAPEWSGLHGPFPTGIWSFDYSH